jgi:GT2 family glycosyltransferase
MVQVDTELALRVVNAGWRIISRGDIVVYHPTPVGGEPFSVKREIYFRARNSIWVGLRDLPIGLWPSFVLRKHWQSFAFAIRLGQLPLYFRAWLDALRLVPRCVMLRRPIKREYILRARAHSLKMWI